MSESVGSVVTHQFIGFKPSVWFVEIRLTEIDITIMAQQSIEYTKIGKYNIL